MSAYDGKEEWFYTAKLSDLRIRQLIMESVSKLQAYYDIDMQTDLGFGYTLEATIKHMQDEDKKGKELVRAYRVFLEQHYLDLYLGKDASKLII